MSLPAFKTINCDTFVTSKLQDNAGSVFTRLLAQPDANKVLVTGVVIRTAATPVLHRLGTQPTGYIVVRRDGPGIIYDAAASDMPLGADTATYLYLAASIQLTATLLVF